MKKAYLLFCKAVQDYNVYFYMFEFETEIQKDYRGIYLHQDFEIPSLKNQV